MAHTIGPYLNTAKNMSVGSTNAMPQKPDALAMINLPEFSCDRWSSGNSGLPVWVAGG
jgi:hypothetical protein